MALEFFHKVKTMVLVPILGRFDGQPGVSVRCNFGMNGQDTAVCVDLKVLNYMIIALK